MRVWDFPGTHFFFFSFKSFFFLYFFPITSSSTESSPLVWREGGHDDSRALLLCHFACDALLCSDCLLLKVITVAKSSAPSPDTHPHLPSCRRQEPNAHVVPALRHCSKPVYFNYSLVNGSLGRSGRLGLQGTCLEIRVQRYKGVL